MVTMPSAKRLPVGGMVLPSPIGIGWLNVPVMTPVAVVHDPAPKRIGCSLILMSGAYTNIAFRSWMCFSMPLVSCPSGHVTTMSWAWLSLSRSHFCPLNTSKSRTSKTLRCRSTLGACISCGGGGFNGFSQGDCATTSFDATRVRAATAVKRIWIGVRIDRLPEDSGNRVGCRRALKGSSQHEVILYRTLGIVRTLVPPHVEYAERETRESLVLPPLAR